MNPFQYLRDRVAAIARKAAREEVETLYERLPQLIEFHTSPPEDRQDFYDHTKDPVRFYPLFERLCDELIRLGVSVEQLHVDISDFDGWMAAHSKLSQFYEKMGASRVQKCLEHYIAAQLLALTDGAIYLDVGAKNSPWATLLRERGIRAYRLDMDYPAGRRGFDIGADACATGLPAEYANAISLQCAYNCFAGDADIRFLTEVARVLKPGGRCVMAPLCLDETHFCTRSAYCDLTGLEPDPGAKWVWRTDGYRLPFVRTYSPEAFRARVLNKLPAALSAKVYYISNMPEMWAHFPGQRIYGFFHLALTKSGP